MMAFSDQSPSVQTERDVLEKLRSTYEGRGYSFQVEPRSDALPSFLGDYRPDALAIRGNDHVIIELKSRKTKASEILLYDLRRRLASVEGWRLDVIYLSSETKLDIPLAGVNAIQSYIGESEGLANSGHERAAFILSWSILEAALNRLNGDEVNNARNPGQVVQALAVRGYLEKDKEIRLRRLADLRNRIVHGDLASQASRDDVAQVLEAIRGTLSGS